jgi:GNAT superfamily N-acetyltransferase
MSFQIVPASSFTLHQLAEIITAGFADSAEPILMVAARLARLIRVEQIDLEASAVLQIDGEPIGQFLLALRAETAWCSRLAIRPAWRRQGLSQRLTETMLARAQATGATRLILEVLPTNTPALAAYARIGMRWQRDLVGLGWEGPRTQAPTELIHEPHPMAVLQHFGRLHRNPPAWQRDLPALLVNEGLRSMVLGDPAYPDAGLLYRPLPFGSAVIADLATPTLTHGCILISALQSRFAELSCWNEPEGSPGMQALLTCGFSERSRQHEFGMDIGQ